MTIFPVPLTPCADLSAADWLVDSDVPWQQLVEFGPWGLPAYARLRFLPDPAYRGQSENDASRAPDAPTETEQLRIALDTLARHTSTPDECYFCLWDGWGSEVSDEDAGEYVTGPAPGPARPGLSPAPRRSRPDRPKVVVPHRAYYLFRGRLSDVGDETRAGWWPGQTARHVPDPAFVWPADRAWCVANDVDPHWAGIGAGPAAIDELLADPRLDVVRADPRQNQPHYF